MLNRKFFVIALLMSAAFTPARADDVSNRVDQLDQQLRQLVGQVEELNYAVKQLQAQLAATPKQTGAVEQPQVVPVKKKLAMTPTAPAVLAKPQISGSESGVEAIGEAPVQDGTAAQNQDAQTNPIYGNTDNQVVAGAAPPQVLGGLKYKSVKSNDGGFQGKLIVPPDSADQGIVTDGGNVPAAAVENVSVQPETPDDLFLRSEKSLLQLQYDDAENGFKEFLAKYPDHNLAGSAQFKLGETFYAQQQYQEAAKNYLAGYKQFPKSRRAPDSMLKLGLAMNKMGQSQQGCAVLGSVGDEFPNAVEVKKRAQAEFKRAGC